MPPHRLPHDALVVGGGLNGLATAWQLRRLGARRVALVERFRAGHDRGSSHGAARITRSTYTDRRYVDLVQQARATEWPRLECDAGRALILDAQGCFFGPPGASVERYAAAVAGVDAVERLDPDAARRRFPQFRFAGMAAVFDDRTAGLVDAAGTLRALMDLAVGVGVEVHEETVVLGIDTDADPLRVRTSKRDFLAERVVITAGAWTAALVPQLRPRLHVKRQTVGYFRLRGDAGAFGPARFPVWACLGDDQDLTHYGMPEFGRAGVKVARHVVDGPADDPDAPAPDPAPAEIALLEDFVREQFTAPLDGLVATEPCLYTVAPNEDFVLDLLPGEPRVVVGAGFSGHGFKFGPLTGRILAELVLRGRTSVAAFEASRDAFRIPDRTTEP